MSCQLFQGASILLDVKATLYRITVKYEGEIISTEINVKGPGFTSLSLLIRVYMPKY